MIFTVIYSSLNGFIWNQHNDQLPVGLLAQLVISHTGLNFFSDLVFTTAQAVFIAAKITFTFKSLSTVHMYDFHIFTVKKFGVRSS